MPCWYSTNGSYGSLKRKIIKQIRSKIFEQNFQNILPQYMRDAENLQGKLSGS